MDFLLGFWIFLFQKITQVNIAGSLMKTRCSRIFFEKKYSRKIAVSFLHYGSARSIVTEIRRKIILFCKG